mmetsp:Transcript_20714/g.19756  ORF Transcript_20714/g.19756 Transcript_20714/m.19756 type:complete len:126 (+) Transcript_20714:412-789(+)
MDYHMETLALGDKYQGLEAMTRDTKLATSRSYIYRERTEADAQGEMALKWHYDRVLHGGNLKDYYLYDGKVLEGSDLTSLTFNDRDRNLHRPLIKNDEILMQLGMSTHILTGGVFPAHNHAVFIP